MNNRPASHFHRARSLFERLPFRFAVRFLLSRLMRAILKPYTIESFSQFGEEQHILQLLKKDSSRFYVDVGANHPIRYSNTFRLYIEGWHGITIDGNASLVDKHKKIRKHDLAMCAVVSDQKEEVFFEERKDSLLSSICAREDAQEVIANAPLPPDIISVHKVMARTLNAICEECGCPSRFGLLNIDVEGGELNVLKGLDFDKFRPHLICLEIHNFDISCPQDSECAMYILSLGYRLDSSVPPSVFFRDCAIDTINSAVFELET